MKDKFLQLIAALTTGMGDLKAKVNTVISGLPPVEQHESAALVMGLTRELGWVIQDIERAAQSATVAKVDEMLASFEAEVIAAAIQAEKVIPIEQVSMRIEAAELAMRTTVETEFRIAAQRASTISARRTTLVADLGDVLAAQFTDDMIVADSFDSELVRVKSALDRIKENGIDAAKTPKAYAFVAATALKPEPEFLAALEVAKEIVAHTPATPTSPAAVPGVTIVASKGKPSGEETSSKKPTLVKPWAC